MDNQVTTSTVLAGSEEENPARLGTPFFKSDPDDEQLRSMLRATMAAMPVSEGQLGLAESTPYYPLLMMKMMMSMEPKIPFFESPFAHMADPNGNHFGVDPTGMALPPLPPIGHVLADSSATCVSPKPKVKPEVESGKKPKSKSPKKSYSSNRRLVESSVSACQSQAAPAGPAPKNPIYRCHLCPYTGNSKLQFNAHMNTHFDHRCPHCDYTSRTEGRLKRHIRDFHSETPPETWSGGTRAKSEENQPEGEGLVGSDDGLTPGGNGPNPARNRKYRCKQCGYVAMDKHDFWEHSKHHIKSDKMLSCPKCNFVTEYKHHLEYHLRNHFGSKPFRCGKCNYSCVNKSMLNSHMKSHSNIYQYRCEDCTYATKYCHSLKLHLRKYSHRPATVLNLDGTPNPYPVIDVYGTRRGPRPKKNSKLRGLFDSSTGDDDGNNNSIGEEGEKESTQPDLDQHSLFSSTSAGSLTSDSSTCSEHTAAPCEATGEAPVTSTSRDEDCPSKPNRASVPNKGSSSSTGSLKCNYCPFHTESKADFSNHLLEHVMKEKMCLANTRDKNKPDKANSKERREPEVTLTPPSETKEISEEGPNQNSAGDSKPDSWKPESSESSKTYSVDHMANPAAPISIPYLGPESYPYPVGPEHFKVSPSLYCPLVSPFDPGEDVRGVKPLDLSGGRPVLQSGVAEENFSPLLVRNSPVEGFSVADLGLTGQFGGKPVEPIEAPCLVHRKRKGQAKRVKPTVSKDSLGKIEKRRRMESITPTFPQRAEPEVTKLSEDMGYSEDRCLGESLVFHNLPPTPTKSPRTVPSPVEFDFDRPGISQPPDQWAANGGLMQIFLQMLSSQMMLANGNMALEENCPVPPPSLDGNLPQQQENVSNLIEKMYSATSLMQEILAELCSIKK